MKRIFSLIALLFLASGLNAAVGIRNSVATTQLQTTSMAVTIPSGTTTNDVTVIYLVHESPYTTFNTPAGWNLLKQCGGLAAFWRAYQGGDASTVTVSWNIFDWVTPGAVSYTGADTTTFVDGANCAFVGVTAASASYKDNNHWAPEIVTSFQNGMEVLAYGNNSNSTTTWTTPSGFTARLNGAGPNYQVYDKTISGGGLLPGVQALGNNNGTYKEGLHFAIKVSGASAASAASAVSLVGIYDAGYGLQAASVTERLLTATPINFIGVANLQAGDLIIHLCGFCTSGTVEPPGFVTLLSTHNSYISGRTFSALDNATFPIAVSQATVSTYVFSQFLVFRAVGSTQYPTLTASSAAGTDITNPSTGIVAPSIVPGSTTDALILWYVEPNGNTDTIGIPTGTLAFVSSAVAPNWLVAYKNSPSNPTGTFTATGTATSVTQATGFSLAVTLGTTKTGTVTVSGSSVIF